MIEFTPQQIEKLLNEIEVAREGQAALTKAYGTDAARDLKVFVANSYLQQLQDAVEFLTRRLNEMAIEGGVNSAMLETLQKAVGKGQLERYVPHLAVRRTRTLEEEVIALRASLPVHRYPSGQLCYVKAFTKDEPYKITALNWVRGICTYDLTYPDGSQLFRIEERFIVAVQAREVNHG